MFSCLQAFTLMLVFEFQQRLLTALMETVTGPSGAECARLELGS